ncbi:MBL fold metallo-hydrolase [Polymorphospora sp. 2-325]|uniref:MBL fold metallo-hydrolase n=1 Tax=Polymorphospora lycopeni TaxID=3140240 RepID=A0ABV5CZY9_9ACTN
MTDVRITHIGGPTALIEFGGWRLLTDPTFDPAGERYGFGWGTSSRKLTDPAITPGELPPIDAVLLTHDHHGDNLDRAGRALLPSAGTVVTTTSGARRLGGTARGLAPWAATRLEAPGRPTIEVTATPARHGPPLSRPIVGGVSGARRLGGTARGLAPWAATRLEAPGRPTIEVTATPARHGPPLSRPIVGGVVGFALRWAGQRHGVLWITGDTVLHSGLRRVADRFAVSVVLLHLGAVRFPVTGPLRYTMTAREGVELCRLVRARTVVPVHYEGWAHFRQDGDAVDGAFATAPDGIRRSLRRLPVGTPATVTV